ncbi:LTA synthase family protein [Clostridium perfringens]|uniref:LTA synthase family protein n=2 Tax=Clostridium perfringens TaxID=1502 RepID=A0AAP4A8W7_CLOPF|nr:LTA synthase family protein [Clostridium perfringens]MDH2337432.1 LTA synthase family protein [Clostridium perfringens]
MEKLKRTLKYIFLNKYVDFLLITILIFYKSLIFTLIWNTPGSNSIYWANMYPYLWNFLALVFFSVILGSVSFLFKLKGKCIYTIIIDVILSFLFLGDLMYFRTYRNFLSIRYIFHPEMFNPLDKYVFNFQKVDVLLFIDLIIIVPFLIWVIKKAHNNSKQRGFIGFIVSIIISVSILFVGHYKVDVQDITKGDRFMFFKGFVPDFTLTSLGPVGMHYYDIYKYFTSNIKLTDEENKEIAQWLKDNREDIPDNEYKGILKGKNIIVIQWESLEEFIVNSKVDGQEITPNINKLLKHALFFDNIFEQNNKGTTSDGELMANASLWPTRKDSYFIEYSLNTTKSIQKYLKQEGYNTISTHGELAGNWNWLENHISFGADKTWDIDQYDKSNTMYLGLYDREMFNGVYDKLKNVKSPYYLFMTTLTSHGPFEIPMEYRMLKLPEEIVNTPLGNYFQSLRYTDEQLGNFINKLEKSGMLKNTAIVIYGDHAGVNKYYKSQLANLKFENRWWYQDDLKVPLIIYDKSLTEKTISTHGGLVDVMPTLLYLMGNDRSTFDKSAMGRVLVNTKEDATMTTDGTIKGNPSEKFKTHLENGYKINDLIIKGDYFKNNQ